MSDLIEILRYADQHSQQRINGSRIFREAADEIERLRAKIDAMQGHVLFAQAHDGVLRRWHPPTIEG